MSASALIRFVAFVGLPLALATSSLTADAKNAKARESTSRSEDPPSLLDREPGPPAEAVPVEHGPTDLPDVTNLQPPTSPVTGGDSTAPDDQVHRDAGPPDVSSDRVDDVSNDRVDDVSSDRVDDVSNDASSEAAEIVPSSRAQRKGKRAPKRGIRRPKGDAECDFRTPVYTHEVVPGEHLGAIAGRYGVRRKDLVTLNESLSNPDVIRPGQSIRVCPQIAPRQRTRIVHTVAPGDTLVELAKQYDLTLEELLSFQPRAIEPKRIRVGQEIVLWVDGPELAAFVAHDATEGGLYDGQRLPDSRHYVIKRPHFAYGTHKTVALIRTAVSRFYSRHRQAPKITIGDISKRGGGPLRGHRSHQTGTDVDVGYVKSGALANDPRFMVVDAHNMDIARSWALIKAFIDTHEIKYIFIDYGLQKLLYEHARRQGASPSLLAELFQYPRSRYRSHGIIRHWRNHADHFHVRFRE